jgi:hypothetical protein
MNLNQTKLTKTEWDGIEVPVSSQELSVLKMIQKGYHDIDIRYNETLSLLGFLKVKNSDSMYAYLFLNYILPEIKSLNEKYDIDEEILENIYKKVDSLTKSIKKLKQINKVDKLRLNNSAKGILSSKDSIFEYVLLKEMESMLSFIEDERYYDALTPIYTINSLIEYDVYGFNPLFKTYLKELWKIITSKVTPQAIISRASNIFEKNPLLLQFADQTLYKHQKKLFTVIKRPGKKLILYTAPTGTGKTMSPLGLAQGKKVIFVCAARHVGLALAKSALSLGRKIGFAFGCETPSDIKLHYSAATDFIKDWKTGGIRKVDNSVGDKVEMIISDVQSYISSMNYMMAFTDDINDIVMYWDEPTISLDYEKHELHSLISKTWRENIIPNIVLSSATLPKESDLQEFIGNVKLNDFDVYRVFSQDFKKTIPVLGEDNKVSMPHMVANNVDDLKKSANHCLIHNSIMRYIDIGEASRFILMVKKSKEVILTDEAIKNKKLNFENVFPTIEDVTLHNIKTYYCELLRYIKPDALELIQESCNKKIIPRYPSTINLTTTDAYTITDGPALYLTNDVEKVAKVFLKESNISKTQMNEIMSSIYSNNDINKKVDALQKQLDDNLKMNEAKEKKMDLTNRQLDSGSRELLRLIDNLQNMVKVISLDDTYIPNKLNHQRKYRSQNEEIENHGKPFCSDIPEGVVKEIMLINGIEDSWKILLMMGIGVFVNGLNPTYVEIMKDLADTQQLYLIIASTDYIYGTNYQFCHGYIGRDLANLSQEKCIQALGRIGRNKLQYNYSVRFRDNNLLKKLFFDDPYKPEAVNINKLFKYD